MTGFAVYDSFGQAGGGWISVGGTSAGAPQWAALMAVVDQGRALAGKAPLANAQANVYALAAGVKPRFGILYLHGSGLETLRWVGTDSLPVEGSAGRDLPVLAPDSLALIVPL